MATFEDLPNEKIEEICEFLDPAALSRLMNTNWRFREACSKVLNRREREYLIEKVIGRWIMCFPVGTNSFDSIHIHISNYESNKLKIEQDFIGYSVEDITFDAPLYSDMNIEPYTRIQGLPGETFTKTISKDIISLRDLLDKLNDRNYRKISTDEIWLRKFKNEYTIYNYPFFHQFFDLNDLDLFDLQDLISKLNINIENQEVNNIYSLREVIIQELDKRGKLVTCE